MQLNQQNQLIYNGQCSIEEIIYNKFIFGLNKMMVRRPDHIRSDLYNFKPSKTPRTLRKDISKVTSSNKSLLKQKSKLTLMYQMNKKYQQQLINHEYIKLRELERYSPKKLRKISSQKQNQNLSPLKLKRSSHSKQKIIPFKLIYSPSNSFLIDENFTLLGKKITQQKLSRNQSLVFQISSQDIILSKSVQDSWLKASSKQPRVGYYTTQNKYVSLFAINFKKIDKINLINHPQTLPIYGSVTLKNHEDKSQKFIITDYCHKSTLKDLLNEFGALDQSLIKHYLRKIILCVYNLHKNKIAHNRLALECIIYQQDGEILINLLKSSRKPLSQQQKHELTYQFPPQTLLSSSNLNSPSNDIWSIGCIALELLTNFQHKSNYYHPYNKFIDSSSVGIKQHSLSFNQKVNSLLIDVSQVRTEKVWMKDSIDILNKVKKIIDNDIHHKQSIDNDEILYVDMCQSLEMREMSPLAYNFVQKCLQIRLQKRPTIDEIMFHSFLKQ